MSIRRIDNRIGCSRFVIHDGLAFFTGHVSAKQEGSLLEQTRSVLKRYDELFALHSLHKENVVMMQAHVRDISKVNEFWEAFSAWCTKEQAPTGYVVGNELSLEGDYMLELGFIVAVD